MKARKCDVRNSGVLGVEFILGSMPSVFLWDLEVCKIAVSGVLRLRKIYSSTPMLEKMAFSGQKFLQIVSTWENFGADTIVLPTMTPHF